MKLIQKALALVLIYALFGMVLATPALAGEASLVNPKLLAGLEPPKGPSAANPPANRRWTTGGKVLTFVGLGLVAAGAVMMFQETPDNEMVPGQTYIRWKRVGGITMGTGAALAILGLTRRH